MQERKITLIDIGAGALPSVTQVAAQNTSWFPMVYVSPGTPPVEGVTPEPVADGVLIEWDAVDQAGVVYIIERGPTQNGPWTEIHRTTETRYLYSDGSGQKWYFRITASVRGKPGQGSVVEATPAPTTAQLVAAQQKLDKEIVDRAVADANEASARARDIGLVNASLVLEAQTRVTQIGQAMDAVAAEGQARANGLLNEKLERQAEITAESEARQSAVESLSRAMSEVAAGSGTQFDSAKIWHFNTTVEGWTSNGGTPTIVDGWLRPFNLSNAYITSPTTLAIDGAAYRFIKVRMRKVGAPAWKGTVWWTTDADATFTAAKSVTIPEPSYDANGIATLDLDNLPWNGGSPIRQVRLDLTVAQTVSAYLLYDYIAIGRPAPGASVALVQEETQARVTALAAEASQRNTLAVQMRGNYTGSDLSQAKGFVGEERTARAAADSAQVQRISTMEARMPAGSGQLASTASVTQLQDAMVAADQANAQATTTVNSKLTGLRMTGDNIVPNSNFATGMEWWTRTVGPAGNSIEWGAASGDAGPGVVIGRGSAASSPWIAVNEAAWQPVKAPRRFRAIFKARAVGTGGNVLMRQHVRDAALVEGVSDVTVAVTSATWQRYTVEWSEIGSTRIEARFTAYVTTVGATIAFDRIEIYDVTDQVANELTASGLQSIATRTGVIEGTLVAQGTALTQVQADLAGKASTSALTSLDSKVSQLGDTVTSQGTALTNVTASLQSIGGDNLLGNSSFEAVTNTPAAVPGWSNNSGGLGAGVTRRQWADSTLPGSTRAWRWELEGVPASGYLEGISTSGVKLMKVESGKAHTVSAYVRGTAGVRVLLQFAWRDAANATISYSGTPAAAQYRAAADWGRISWTGTAPAAAVTCVVYIRVYGANVPDQWVEWDNVQVQVGSVATGYAPSLDEIASATAANASAASTLTGKVTALEGTTIAQGQAITTVSAGLAQANRSGNNMIVDGSFEGRVAGTTLAAWAVIAPGGRTGTNALVVSGDGVARSTIIQTFDVTPGRVYFAEAWVKRVGSATGGTIQLRGNLSLNGASATFPAFQQLNVSQLSAEDWVKISGKLTVPEGKNQLHLQAYHNGSVVAGQQILWDDFVLLDVTEAAAAQGVADATANGLSALTTTVTQQGGQITAQATQLNQVRASVAGKADAEVVTSMSATVASLGRGGNLITNSTFPQWQRNGWGWYSNPWGFRELGNPTGDSAWTPTGVSGIGSVKAGVLANGQDGYFGTEYFIGIEGGRTYCISGYMSTHRCSMALYAEFYDAAGAIVGNISCPYSNARTEAPITLSRIARPFAIGKAPATAASARIVVRVVGTGESDPYFWLWRPMFSEVGDGATSAPPWAAGGTESSASWQVMMNTDGYVSGLQLTAKGQTSQFNVLASAMNILSPGGADGIEMTKGYLRVWRGNSQRIIGNGFGNSGEGLIDYFGPNVGAVAASKANATVWMDVNGNAYWGGSLAAGVLRNAVQSTQTTTVGTQVVNGPFGSNGRHKSVVVGFSRRVNRQKGQYGPQGFVAGGGSNTCTVNIFRKVDNDPETFWTSFTAGGGVDIYNETDGPDIATSYWSGSVTLNDGSDGSRPRQYRAEIVGYSEQAVTHQSGTFDSQTINQSLSIVSTEV